MRLKILVTSANLNTWPCTKLFINIKNSKGPSTEPCGTPLHTSSPTWPFAISTYSCFLLLNQSLMVCNNLPLIPCFYNVCNNLRWGTLSKALAKSKKTATQYPSSTLRKILSGNRKRRAPLSEFMLWIFNKLVLLQKKLRIGD